MNEKHNPEIRVYPSRSGERIDAYMAILSDDPETPLDNAERERVMAFETGLIEGHFLAADGRELRAHEERSLDQVSDQSKYLSTRHEITGDYFLTAEGRSLLEASDIHIDESVSTPTGMLDALREVADSTDRLVMKKLADDSRKWATKQMIEEFQSGVETPDFARGMLFNDTAKIRNTLQAFEAYRDFCLDVKSELRDSTDDSTEMAAKRDIVNLYLKVINGRLAEIYPDVLWAWDQANASGNEREKRDLREIWPAGEVFASMRPEVRRSYILALDRLRNGAAYENGQPTAINQELRDLFAGNSPDLHEQEEVRGGRFTPEEHAELSKIRFDAKTMQAFAKDVLAELGLLSSEPDDSYYEDRQHRAADGKWQVIVRRGTSAMGAEDPEGVLEIPESFDRDLTKASAPIGAIPGVAHETMHVYQYNNAKKNKGALRLAGRIRGRSSLVLREAGAVLTEHEIQEELFGASRPDGPHYMRAMEVIEAGGGEKAAVRAFYESYSAANPNEPFEKCVRDAESRVMRLCRRYGGYNSQPLNYAQTAAFVTAAERMTDEQRAMVFAEGVFDLPDMVTLHQYGLLSKGAEQFPVQEFCDIVERKLRTMLGTLDVVKAMGVVARS